MKKRIKLDSVLYLLSGICFFIAAIIGKKYVFIPIDLSAILSILFIEFSWGEVYELYKSYEGKSKKGSGL